MGLSVFKLLVILIIVFVVFGAGKLPQVMGDLGKGIKALKDGLQGDDKKEPAATPTLTAETKDDQNKGA